MHKMKSHRISQNDRQMNVTMATPHRKQPTHHFTSTLPKTDTSSVIMEQFSLPDTPSLSPVSQNRSPFSETDFDVENDFFMTNLNHKLDFSTSGGRILNPGFDDINLNSPLSLASSPLSLNDDEARQVFGFHPDPSPTHGTNRFAVPEKQVSSQQPDVGTNMVQLSSTSFQDSFYVKFEPTLASSDPGTPATAEHNPLSIQPFLTSNTPNIGQQQFTAVGHSAAPYSFTSQPSTQLAYDTPANPVVLPVPPYNRQQVTGSYQAAAISSTNDVNQLYHASATAAVGGIEQHDLKTKAPRSRGNRHQPKNNQNLDEEYRRERKRATNRKASLNYRNRKTAKYNDTKAEYEGLKDKVTRQKGVSDTLCGLTQKYFKSRFSFTNMINKYRPVKKTQSKSEIPILTKYDPEESTTTPPNLMSDSTGSYCGSSDNQQSTCSELVVSPNPQLLNYINNFSPYDE